MFPAPTTIASSTPCCCTSTISPATVSIRSRSSPYSFSPISASPESLSSTRLKTARAGWATSLERTATRAPSGHAVARLLPGGSLTELEPLEFEHFGALLAEHLSDGLRRLVNPGLVDEHLLG